MISTCLAHREAKSASGRAKALLQHRLASSGHDEAARTYSSAISTQESLDLMRRPIARQSELEDRLAPVSHRRCRDVRVRASTKRRTDTNVPGALEVLNARTQKLQPPRAFGHPAPPPSGAPRRAPPDPARPCAQARRHTLGPPGSQAPGALDGRPQRHRSVASQCWRSQTFRHSIT